MELPVPACAGVLGPDTHPTWGPTCLSQPLFLLEASRQSLGGPVVTLGHREHPDLGQWPWQVPGESALQSLSQFPQRVRGVPEAGCRQP